MSASTLAGRLLAPVSATGGSARPVLFSAVGLSFWGGVDLNGRVVDARHPLYKQSLKDHIIALPGGVGSCTGSQVLLELILGNASPAGIIVRHRDEVLSVASIVAAELFDRRMPVVAVSDGFERLATAERALITRDGSVVVDPPETYVDATTEAQTVDNLSLSEEDRLVLAGERGKARAAALRIVCRVADVVGASSLVDVSRAHIDACVYVGPASLRFAQQLVDMGGRFKVKTTTNSASVDLKNWEAQGVSRDFGVPATKLARAYQALGAEPTFTCAPYLLVDPPTRDEHLGWSESNAVAFANSCLGARTNKNADFMDACVAITGRAPLAGPHLNRKPTFRLKICLQKAAESVDDAFWPLAGYCVGKRAGAAGVPLVDGLQALSASRDDLKNFAAAFATTSGSPLFHVLGHTPEAEDAAGDFELEDETLVDADELHAAWLGFNTKDDVYVDVIAFGSPHASLEEILKLAELVEDRRKASSVRVVVTLAQSTLDRAKEVGGESLSRLDAFGVEFIVDTCWCMLTDRVHVPKDANILTNSAKYAHYAGGLVQPNSASFAGIEDCVRAAVSGRFVRTRPKWS